MAIRKTGAVTGEVTEVDGLAANFSPAGPESGWHVIKDAGGGGQRRGSLGMTTASQDTAWGALDEDALAGENEAADQG